MRHQDMVILPGDGYFWRSGPLNLYLRNGRTTFLEQPMFQYAKGLRVDALQVSEFGKHRVD